MAHAVLNGTGGSLQVVRGLVFSLKVSTLSAVVSHPTQLILKVVTL